MPITDYRFEDRIFFAKELGVISGNDAAVWAAKLKECAEQMPIPIVAVVDALAVTIVTKPAVDTFSKASHIPNLLAVVVATSTAVNVTARNIGLLGKRGQTIVFPSLNEARNCAQELLEEADS